MTKLTVKSSTIFVSTGDTTQVYHSLSEMPQSLRARLERSTSGANSATILIADKRGREELAHAVRQQPAHTPHRPAKAVHSIRHHKRASSLRTWLELFIPIALGAVLWFLLRAHLL